jgi:hypothetical protein
VRILDFKPGCKKIPADLKIRKAQVKRIFYIKSRHHLEPALFLIFCLLAFAEFERTLAGFFPFFEDIAVKLIANGIRKYAMTMPAEVADIRKIRFISGMPSRKKSAKKSIKKAAGI